MVKAVISGYYGFKNFGDETILSVLIKHLRNLNVDITVFSSDPNFTEKTYGINSIKSFDMIKVLCTLRNTDVLISGGGSLLQDATSLKSLIYYLSVIALALFFNKKVIIFAQGIGPVNNKFARLILINLLKLCSLVTVRDEASLNFLNKYGVSAKLVCDPVYSLEVNPTSAKNIAGVQLREFKTMNYALLQKLALFIKEKFGNCKIEIFSLQENLDLALCKKFEDLLHSIAPDIRTEIVTEDIINRISNLEYMIGMRFHALLTAIKCGVKTCAINYDIKVERLAKDASIPMISMDAHENFEEIYSKMQNLKRDELLRFADNKSFDWSDFDKLFIFTE